MAPPSDSPRKPAALILAVLALANAGLSTYQWLELVAVRHGAVPTCAINETINCAAVWNSAFAARVHDAVGLPVAGLGLLWSLVAFTIAVLALRRERSGQPTEAVYASVKLWALLGALSCLTLATASFALKAVCLTCLATYALTLGFAFVAMLMLPGGAVPQLRSWPKAALPLLVLALPAWGLLLYPASKTPKNVEAKVVAPVDGDASKYFASLSEGEKQAFAEARKAYKDSATPDVSMYPPRFRLGSANATLVMVDFTDVLCPHCRALVKGMNAIERVVPRDALALEPRYFPLDGECNPAVGRKSGDPVRCLGAKIQLCLEGRPGYQPAREEIFERQDHLDAEVLWEIGTKYMTRMELSACVASPQTQARLEEDIKYALAYKIDGTPLVLLNGRATLPVKDFIYGMALSKGDPDSPIFGVMPEAHGIPER